MEAKFWQYWAEPRNRMLFIFIGLFLGLCSIILSKAEVEIHTVGGAPPGTALAPKTETSGAKETVQAVGASRQSSLKDPFIAPFAASPEYAQKTADQGDGVSLVPVRVAKASVKRIVQKPPVALPNLTGIISINNQKIALMEYEKESKQCSEDEQIGPYQIVRVAQENVTLVGPEGTVILEVGQ